MVVHADSLLLLGCLSCQSCTPAVPRLYAPHFAGLGHLGTCRHCMLVKCDDPRLPAQAAPVTTTAHSPAPACVTPAPPPPRPAPPVLQGGLPAWTGAVQPRQQSQSAHSVRAAVAAVMAMTMAVTQQAGGRQDPRSAQPRRRHDSCGRCVHDYMRHAAGQPQTISGRPIRWMGLPPVRHVHNHDGSNWLAVGANG